MTIIDALEDIWTKILDVTALFITPDWNAIVAMLPILVFIGIVGPFITFTLLGSVIYLVRKPRVKVEFDEGPRVAEIGADGEPIFPPGLPFCRRHSLIYPSGVLRCERTATCWPSPARCAASAATPRSTPARTAASSSR